MTDKTVDLKEFRDKHETYKVDTHCVNCLHIFNVVVAKGRLVAEHNRECPKCGCTPKQVEEFYKSRHSSGPVPYESK